MSTKQLDDLLKRANKVIDNYDNKLKQLDASDLIVSSIIFLNDVDYNYLFTIYKDDKAISKIMISDAVDYKKTFKELVEKYKTNIIYCYNDLTNNQLEYLDTLSDANINKSEIGDILFKRQFDIF